MIRPGDVNTVPGVSDFDRKMLDNLEQDFDHAIRMASATGHWPALVYRMRDTTKSEVIEAVADKYRQAGWVVDTSNERYRARIVSMGYAHLLRDEP